MAVLGESFLEMGPENVGNWKDAHMTEHLRSCTEMEILILRGIRVVMLRIAKLSLN